MNHRHVLPILGPAGCGKGTACDHLKKLAGTTILTTSEVLMQYADKHPAAAETIKHYKTVRRQNVPDEIAASAMTWKLQPTFRQQHSGLWGLDGYGRGPGQIRALAEWIENRNIDYERKGKEKIRHGYVFFNLSFEETMKRVEDRIEKARRDGVDPRPDDLGDFPKLRFEEYSKLEDLLISTARACTGLVHTIDLSKHTTLEAAAMIYGSTYEIDPAQITARLQAA